MPRMIILTAEAIHASPWGNETTISSCFTSQNIDPGLLDLVRSELPLPPVDLVYFDAFDPKPLDK